MTFPKACERVTRREIGSRVAASGEPSPRPCIRVIMNVLHARPRSKLIFSAWVR